MRPVRREASILHLDLDAFFASVEQRDKPSLRGKPVVVGGLGQRGVVATASYEARIFGVRSAMPTHEARRRCPHAAFLVGRFGAYRAASRQVMEVLRRLSPLVEPLSMDEAFVDLRAQAVDFSREGLERLVNQLKDDVHDHGRPDRLGRVASSKFVAKGRRRLAKPNGWSIVAQAATGTVATDEGGVFRGWAVTRIKLHRIGIYTVADPQACAFDELAQVIGGTHATPWWTWRTPATTGRLSRIGRPNRLSRTPSKLILSREISLRRSCSVMPPGASRPGRRLFAFLVSIKVRLHDFLADQARC
jgi:DNA polymerase-4